MSPTEATNSILNLAAECSKFQKTERAELEWLKQKHLHFMRMYRFTNKKTADIFLYRQIYGRDPKTENDLLKLRYWRTGRHLPVSHELCSAYGKALRLDKAGQTYLLQGYYDSCDRLYETENMQDPLYRKRRILLEHLVENYLSNITEERLAQMKIYCHSQLIHNLRHLYYTDALNYVCLNYQNKDLYLTKHITSITYDSELKRTLQLLGAIPRKTMLRHLIIFGMPYISLDLINQQLKDLGYLPLDDPDTTTI